MEMDSFGKCCVNVLSVLVCCVMSVSVVFWWVYFLVIVRLRLFDVLVMKIFSGVVMLVCGWGLEFFVLDLFYEEVEYLGGIWDVVCVSGVCFVFVLDDDCWYVVDCVVF